MEDSETKTHPEQQVDTDLTNPPVTNAENGVRKDEPRKEDLITNEDHVQESSENVKVPTETGPVGDGSIAIAANPTTAQETMQEANCDGVIDSDLPYMAPLDDPLDKAAKFLSKHDIFGLLQVTLCLFCVVKDADFQRCNGFNPGSGSNPK